MSNASRNQPCPCGSGKKYKHCCWTTDTNPKLALDPRARLFLDTDQRMTAELMRFADTLLEKGWFKSALAQYRAEDTPVDPELEFPLFIPWALFHDRSYGSTIAEMYFRKPPRPLGPTEREWAEVERKTWLSLWEVTRVERNKGLHVTDHLTGEFRFVHEIRASKSLVDRESILCRVVDYPDFSVFSGLYPRSLQPREANDVVQEFRKYARRKLKPLDIAPLRETKSIFVLTDIWRNKLDDVEAGSRMPRRLANTDGDPLLLTTDLFSFRPAARAHVIASLCALEYAVEIEKDAGVTCINFLKMGNRSIHAMENTIIGVARVGPDKVHLETNSLKRADALRERVMGACPQLGASPLREHQDPMAMLKNPALRDSGGPAPRGLEENPPELQAVLREFKERHYREWPDKPVPALGGLTPRDAARRARSRPPLELLLRELENSEARLPKAERFDVGELRRELGMEG